MKIGYLQFYPEFGNVKKNIGKIENLAVNKEFDLLVIPELSNSGYSFVSREEVEEFSEKPEDGIFCNSILKLASDKNSFIVAGFCERADENGKTNYYNSCILACPDNKFFIYRKIHLFEEEKNYFERGNIKFNVIEISSPEIGKVKIGMMICFDWIFPEAARTLALKGAQIICHPSNLVMPYCQQAMFARAVENGVYIITSNRTGTENRGGKEITFTGKSVIIDHRGKYLATGSESEEEIKIVDIKPTDALDKFINKNNNVIEDRRKEFYEL